MLKLAFAVRYESTVIATGLFVVGARKSKE